MEFQILGRLQVEVAGHRVPLGGAREQNVLAVLLLDANRMVPLSRLVDALWDDDPPATAAKQVRNTVSRLRCLLAGGGLPDVMVTDGTGYRLAVAEEALDARQFELRTAEAALAASAGQVGEAAALYRSALDLWRGPALAGLRGEVIDNAATAWNERRHGARANYYDCQLELGRHRAVLGELTEFVRDDPLREEPAAQLMLALYRCGRQADALALYTHTRALLADELGLDPGPPLQRLHQQILNGDTSLAPSALPRGHRGGHAPAASQPADRAVQDPAAGPGPAAALVPRQLPAATRHFVGRTDDLKVLTGLLDEPGGAGGAVLVAAISGPAGIGKTALAMHWAHEVSGRFRDGQLYVNLRGNDPSGSPVAPAEAVRGFLGALGVPVERLPESLDAQTALYRSLLAGKRVLVLLDNAAAPEQVRPLLPGAPGCFAVVTSRSRLSGLVAIDGAHRVTLLPLAESDAMLLLQRILGPERAAGELTAAAEITEYCGRLPLALRIAADRAASRPHMKLADLAGQLAAEHDRLDVLASDDDQTAAVRAVFSWSYAALPADAARLFRLLGLHPGPDISVPASAALAALALVQAGRLLDVLAGAHLLEETAFARYRFHDLLRSYAAERAVADETAADRGAAIHRIGAWYLHAADAADRVLEPTHRAVPLDAPEPHAEPPDFASYEQALAWFEAEQANLVAVTRQAATSGHDDIAWKLPQALWNFLEMCGSWDDVLTCARIGIAAAQRAGSRDGEARGLNLAGSVYFRLGQYGDALSNLQRALAIRREAGDQRGEAILLDNLGSVFGKLGRPAERLTSQKQALALALKVGDRSVESVVLGNLGEGYREHGLPSDALSCHQQALLIVRETGNSRRQAIALENLGETYRMLGQLGDAIDCYQQAMTHRRQAGDRHGEAATLECLGDALAASGQARSANECWHQALTILEGLGDPRGAEIHAKLESAS